jgi:hypothetical protein
MDIQDLADKLAHSFETAARSDGETFLKLKDGCPDWMQELVRYAHNNMPPDDIRYKMICEACESIADYVDEDAECEFADSVDVYSSDLTNWLASSQYRPAYVDDAVSEMGHAESGIDDHIMQGQYTERLEVYNLVKDALQNALDDIELEEEN